MRRATIAVFLLSAAALRAQSSCPTTAPQGFGARLEACTADAPCLDGNSALLPLTPIVPDCAAPPPGSPPPPSCTIYRLQACDRLTWDFGDGTPPMDGAMITSHTYATPGVYHLTVTITNALGTAQIGIIDAVTIASNPPTYVDVSPSDVTVPETAGSITFTLARSPRCPRPIRSRPPPSRTCAYPRAVGRLTSSCASRRLSACRCSSRRC